MTCRFLGPSPGCWSQNGWQRTPETQCLSLPDGVFVHSQLKTAACVRRALSTVLCQPLDNPEGWHCCHPHSTVGEQRVEIQCSPRSELAVEEWKF